MKHEDIEKCIKSIYVYKNDEIKNAKKIYKMLNNKIKRFTLLESIVYHFVDYLNGGNVSDILENENETSCIISKFDLNFKFSTTNNKTIILEYNNKKLEFSDNEEDYWRILAIANSFNHIN